MAKEIDIETGLPKLPKGWRWEVREHFPHRQMNYFHIGFSREYLGPASTKELSVRLSRGAEEVSQPPRKHWWSKMPDVTVKTTWDVEYTELTQGTAAIAVFNAASKIYNRWQADIDRRKLVGNYPPKSINANNQDA